jgi:anti-anti-sigma factor
MSLRLCSEGFHLHPRVAHAAVDLRAGARAVTRGEQPDHRDGLVAPDRSRTGSAVVIAEPLGVPVTVPAVLDVSVLSQPTFVLVTATGEVDVATCGLLRDELDRLWDAGCEDVVLDLREVTFMDSTGAHALIQHHRRAVDAGKRFSIIDGSGPVARLLELIEISDVLVRASPDRVG